MFVDSDLGPLCWHHLASSRISLCNVVRPQEISHTQHPDVEQSRHKRKYTEYILVTKLLVTSCLQKPTKKSTALEFQHNFEAFQLIPCLMCPIWHRSGIQSYLDEFSNDKNVFLVARPTNWRSAPYKVEGLQWTCSGTRWCRPGDHRFSQKKTSIQHPTKGVYVCGWMILMLWFVEFRILLLCW